MPKPIFTVEPQRSDGRGYTPCDLYRATSFAVFRTDKHTRKGKVYTVTRVLGRYPTRNQAVSVAEANAKSFAPTPANLVRKLGKRIISNA